MLLAILIIVLFASLVIVHEWGHFMAARRGGVKVEEFGFGFPPKVWGKKIKGTLYTINLLPLGGFVRLKGEDGEETGPHTFGAARYWTKAKILLAGVGMNLISAFVILYALCVSGLPGLGAEFEPGFLHTRYAQPKQLMVTRVESGSPAAGAGVAERDYLLRIDTTKLESEDQLSAYTKAHAGQDVTLQLRRGDDERQVKVHLRAPEAGKGFLGVATQALYKLAYDPLTAVLAAAYITVKLFVLTILGIVKVFASVPNLILGLFSAQVPEAAQATSGPVGIFFILKNISIFGLSYVFLFLANISVALAAFNALPLPALDGGRLFIITLQKLFRRELDPETEAKIHSIGFMLLIGLMVIFTIYDIRKPH